MAAKKQTSTKASPAPVIAGEAGIRVRMYRVGFGDFFLLTLKSGKRIVHTLIDCGVHAKPTGSIDDAIAQLETDTGGNLALIIMTHRHADHISGFGSGADTFARFKVERIWMPWFENPKDAIAVRLQANLTAVGQRLQLAFAARQSETDEQYRLMAENITGVFDAAGHSSNDKALAVLNGGFANKPEIDYVKAGDVAPLPASLVQIGVSAQILGPPIDPGLISQMDGKSHQYLDELEADNETKRKADIFAAAFVTDATSYETGNFDRSDLRQVEKRVRQSQPDIVRAIAAKADSTLNNQSVVVLLEFNGKKLLFSGDAQWGNWQNFLFGGALGSPGHDKLSAEAKAILGSIDFYKVGHHGSTNATPIDALDAMREGLVAMCSTAELAYNKVPREPLMTALSKKTGGKLARSDQVSVPGFPAINEPLDATFSTPTNQLFIDYHL